MDTKQKLEWTIEKMLVAADHRKNHEEFINSKAGLRDSIHINHLNCD